VHGLVERQPRLDALAVLDLGVQNSPPGALQAALSARLAEPLPPSADLTADGALTLAWTLRGAPHLHRTADLPVLAAAGWPRDDADAGARLARSRGVVRLLPPSDPYLQGRDRELLVPDPAHRKQIWTSIGAPGVVVSAPQASYRIVEGKRVPMASRGFAAFDRR